MAARDEFSRKDAERVKGEDDDVDDDVDNDVDIDSFVGDEDAAVAAVEVVDVAE